MKKYEAVIGDALGEAMRTTVNDEELNQLILLLRDSNCYELLNLRQIYNFQPIEDVLEILKKEIKPKSLAQG